MEIYIKYKWSLFNSSKVDLLVWYHEHINLIFYSLESKPMQGLPFIQIGVKWASCLWPSLLRLWDYSSSSSFLPLCRVTSCMVTRWLWCLRRFQLHSELCIKASQLLIRTKGYSSFYSFNSVTLCNDIEQKKLLVRLALRVYSRI